MRNKVFILILSIVTMACHTDTGKKSNNVMEQEKIKAEVIEMEHMLLKHLREGRIKEGLAIHLDSPTYRNIWNGEIKTFDMLEQQLNLGIENGLKSIDYKVQSRELNIINEQHVLATLTVVETSHIADTAVVSGLTAVSLVWQKNAGNWKLGYVHASELPK